MVQKLTSPDKWPCGHGKERKNEGINIQGLLCVVFKSSGLRLFLKNIVFLQNPDSWFRHLSTNPPSPSQPSYPCSSKTLKLLCYKTSYLYKLFTTEQFFVFIFRFLSLSASTFQRCTQTKYYYYSKSYLKPFNLLQIRLKKKGVVRATFSYR